MSWVIHIWLHNFDCVVICWLYDLFTRLFNNVLYSWTYEAEFIQNILKSGEKKLAKQFNLTFRYMDDVLSLNDSNFSTALISYISVNWKLKTPQNPGTILHILTYNSNLTIRLIYTLGFMTNEMTTILLSFILHIRPARYHQLLLFMEFTFHSLFAILGLVHITSY